MSRPDVGEFDKFIRLLMSGAPDGYEPWLFRCEKQGKAPAVEFGSWKADENQLTVGQAKEWMGEGGNIGIAGMPGDRLVNVDIDDDDATNPDDVKPSLSARSRSRTGRHFWYFEDEPGDVPNIPTDDKGEVRAQGQYVLAPGSYVSTDPDDVPDDQRELAGFYTVEDELAPANIGRDELPDIFQLALRKSEHDESETEYDIPEPSGGSALFDITARDVVAKEGASTDPSDRWESAFHGSTTGSNMSLSNKGRIQCWRHNVAHGGLQALVALSEHPASCEDIGTGHKSSNAGPSCIVGDDSSIWFAWKYAKENGYIPDDDPIPYNAIKHICRSHDVCPVTALPTEYDPENGKTIPAHAWDTALSIVENHYELNPGRSKTSAFAEQEAAADGGTAAVEPAATKTEEETPAEIKPGAVLSRAGYDPEENDLSDVKPSEAAYAIDRILEDVDDWHFLVVDDDTEDVFSFDEDDGVWKRDGERKLKQVCRMAMGRANSKKAHSETVYAIKGNPNIQIHRDDLGAPAGTIATPNGLLDLRERQTEPLKPKHHALNRIRTSFNPAAEYEGSRWMEFLENSVQPTDMDKLQEYAGYCLWHHAQPFGKALFLVGPTDSGKGTFLKAISQVIGTENISNESLYDLLQTRWGAARLFGNMINVRNEVTPGGLKNIQKFKEMTGGGDSMSGEFKGQDKFEFRVTQKFLFSTNQMPEVENGDGAFYNRLLFAVFPDTVPEEDQDKDLLDKLDEERETILNWMLDGLDRLMLQSRFSGERSREDKETIMQEHGDAVDRFAANVLDVTGDNEDVVHKGDLYEVFIRFNDYIGRDPVVQQTMTSGLKEIDGISDGQSRKVDGDTSRPRVFKGIRVRPEALKEIQADDPRHSYSDEDDGDGPSDQQRLN